MVGVGVQGLGGCVGTEQGGEDRRKWVGENFPGCSLERNFVNFSSLILAVGKGFGVPGAGTAGAGTAGLCWVWLPRGQQCSAGSSSSEFVAPCRMEAAKCSGACRGFGSPGTTEVTVIPPIPSHANGAEQGMAPGGEMCFILLRLGLSWAFPVSPEFIVIHNGIITNYKDLRKFLVSDPWG